MKKNLGFSAEEYARIAGFDSDWRDEFWSQDFLDLLARRWQLEDAPRVLDVGCGAGHWGQRLATLTRDAHVVGVDHEPGFLRAASERAVGRPGTFETREGRAEALPFDDETFDLVTCHTVLIHVADAAPVVAEMARVTRPGGRVVLAEPNNLINLMVSYAGLPAAPWEETMEQLGFDHACLLGKRALGQGDNAVGERLGALLTDAGLVELEISSNERCSWLVPPYSTTAAQTTVEMIRTWVERDMTRWGDEARARELFEAGGGQAAAFDGHFARMLARQRRTLALIESGDYVWGGGHCMYVATARKA